MVPVNLAADDFFVKPEPFFVSGGFLAPEVLFLAPEAGAFFLAVAGFFTLVRVFLLASPFLAVFFLAVFFGLMRDNNL